MPTKNLQEGEYLLVKNKFQIESEGRIEESNLQEVVRQKPNRKIFFVLRFHLGMYNLFSPTKIEKRNERKSERLARKNEKREAKGKEPKEFKPVLSDRLRNTVGEPPTIYDSILTQRSTELLHTHLFNRGYFNNEVTFTVTRKPRRKRIYITYHVKAGRPYRVKDVRYSIDDYELLNDVKEATKGTLLRPGDNFNLETIDKERARLTKSMRNQGFYDFGQEYVIYEVDTTNNAYRADIKEFIEDPVVYGTTASGKDTTLLGKHTKYTIRQVYVNAAYSSQYENNVSDTLLSYGIIFTNVTQLRHNPKTIAKNIFVKSGDIYKQEAQEYTYQRLSSLKNFRFINIAYVKVEGTSQLDCYINLTPTLNQSASVETEGTNTGGNLGVSGNLNYTHRNIFGGAELLQVKVRGGFEAQQTSNTAVVEGSDDEEFGIGGVNIFNTFEYGAETSLNIPELLIPKRLYGFTLPKYNNPKTTFSLSYNFQNRPDYARQLSNAAFSYHWSGVTKHSNDYIFLPFNFSIIQIDRDSAFDARLEAINNPFYTSAYQDHLILGSKFSHFWSNKGESAEREDNFTLNRVTIELAGNALTTAMNVLGETRDSEGSFQFLGIRYAQYVRVDNDIRFHQKLNRNTKMVYRFYGGIGLPYDNLNVLPLNRSFFVGGANDIRAWLARALGPGSLSDADKQSIDQVGDILLEGNLEYRYKITQTVEGALFADAGNIWLLDRDDQDEEAEFRVDRFYREIALGLGLGLRFDFSFLLLRFDYGLQVHDPSLDQGERWLFQPKDLYNEANTDNYRWQGTFNLGIGYPF